MRLHFIVIMVLSTWASVFASKAYAQYTLVVEDKNLKDVLMTIENQSGMVFMYNNALLKDAKKVTVTLRNQPLQSVLQEVFKNQPLAYKIIDRTIVISAKPKPIINQVNLLKDVTGKVVDEKDLPLVGATVKHLKSGRTVATDSHGVFSFKNIGEEDFLEISYLGYQALTINAGDISSPIKLLLSANELGGVEIVSTGFQKLSKKDATGTIEHIGQEVLANRPNTDLSAMLQGVVAGMQAKESADGNVSFTIRGISTLGTENNQRSPLIVIDGFPLNSGDFSAINPNDVESVDILKDAAAAAIWGARSANGVIVITTKKGSGRSGLTINASAFTRVAQRPDLDQINPIANAADQVAYEKMAFNKKIYATAGLFYQGGLFPFDFGISLTKAQQLLFANQYGRLSTADMNAGLDALSKLDNRSQIQDYLMRHALTQQYNVNFNNNTEKSNTYLSLLLEDQKDRFVGNGYRKYDVNFSNEYKLTKFLTVNFNTFLQYNGRQNSGVTLTELNGYPNVFGGGLSSYEMLLNPDGSYASQVPFFVGGTGGPDPYILSSQFPMSRFPYPDWSYNVLREVRGRDLQTMNYNARIQTGLTLKIIPGLTLDAKVQFERGKRTVRNYYSDDTFYVRNLVNSNLQYNNTTKVIGNVYIPKGGILKRGDADLNLPNNDITNYNYRGQLSYVKQISDKFSVNAAAGGEIYQNRTDGIIYPWMYGYNPTTMTSVVPPYGYGSSVDVFTGGTVTGGNLSAVPGGNTTLSYALDRYVSYFAVGDVTYNKKYTLSMTIRGDASNYITDNSSLRWAPFWSVGANWNVKAEKFLTNTKWVDFLNFRASYGSNGTPDKSTSTEALVTMGTSPNVGTGTIIGSISSYGNPLLRWETSKVINLGIDFGLFQNKLSGNISAYNKNSDYVTAFIILPSAYGTSSQKFNSASLLNRGIELQLGTSVKLPAGFGYSTAMNYAYNYNKITDLYFPTPSNQALVTGSAFVEGRPVNSFYTYNYAGVDAFGIPQVYGLNGAKFGFNSQTLLANTDGITAGYMNYAGTTTPPHTFGWSNTLMFGNFSLTAQLIGTFGGHFLNPSFNYGSAFVGYGKTAPNRFVRQVLDGDPAVPPITADPGLTLWPRYSPYLTSHVESSSYVQLKELFLSYNLPQSVLSRIKIKNANLFVQARDLGLIWNNNTNNYHPDFLPGADRPATTYTFGLKFGL